MYSDDWTEYLLIFEVKLRDVYFRCIFTLSKLTHRMYNYNFATFNCEVYNFCAHTFFILMSFLFFFFFCQWNISCIIYYWKNLFNQINSFFNPLTHQVLENALYFSCLNRADLIRVHDGKDSTAPTIEVLCNQGAELEVLSTGPYLYLEFVANSEWPGQGFKAKFQFQPVDDTGNSGEFWI